mgnify:CR=1 FL=1
MRGKVTKRKIRLADISHDWGVSRGWVCRQEDESWGEHAYRLSCELAQIEKFAPYAAAMARGESFPPVYIVQRGDDLLLVDGCHRVAGAALNGWGTIDAKIVRASSDDDASELADSFWDDEISRPVAHIHEGNHHA